MIKVYKPGLKKMYDRQGIKPTGILRDEHYNFVAYSYEENEVNYKIFHAYWDYVRNKGWIKRK